MHDVATALPPAGWYPDPMDAGARRRWWDGAGWTAHVRDVTPEPPSLGTPLVPPVAQTVSSSEGARRAGGYEPQPSREVWHATEPTMVVQGSAQTLAGWLFALSPLWVGGVAVGLTLLLPFVDRGYLVLPAILVALGLTFGLARLDGARLAARGYDAPSPGWVLLPIVYFIVRTVRTGVRGLAMLLVFLIMQFGLVGSAALSLGPMAQQIVTTGQTAKGVWPAVLTQEQRDYLLTADGLSVGVSHALGDVRLDAVSCAPFESLSAGSQTRCWVAAEDLYYEVLLVATPDDPAMPYAVIAGGPVDSPSDGTDGTGDAVES